MTTAGTWDGHRVGSPAYRRILIALTAAAIVAFSQLYAPQGILPLIGRGLDVSAATSALTVSAGTVGLAASVLGWSWVADRFGRAPAMKVAVIVSTVLGLLAAAAPTFGILLSVRILQGVAMAAIPALAVTYLAEEVHRSHLAAAAGVFVSGTSIGGLAGRVLAAPVGDLAGWRWGMLAVGVLSAIAGVVFLVLLPAPRGFVRPGDDRPRASGAAPG